MKREHTIAITVLGGLALLVFGVNYLKGLDLLQRRNVYYAVYTNVQGLTGATPLQINGFKIGQVLGAALLPDGTGRIVITYQVNEDDLEIPRDSRIEIGGDLFSTWAQLYPGRSKEMAQGGDTLMGNTQPSLTAAFNQTIDPLKQKAEGMIANIDSVLSGVQSIFNKEALGDIDASFASIRKTLETLSHTADQLDQLIVAERTTLQSTLGNLNRVSRTLADNGDEMTRIFQHLDSASAALANGRLEKVMNDLNTATGDLKGIMTGINSGKGTLGALVTNDSLYNNLNNASRELDLLLEDMRVNPNRYFSVFGKKDRMPKLSESDIQRIKQAVNKGQ